MLQRAAVAALAALCALCTPSRALPHGGGWVPSGAWSSPAAFGTVQHVGVNPWPATGWTDYSVDPWATQVRPTAYSAHAAMRLVAHPSSLLSALLLL